MSLYNTAFNSPRVATPPKMARQLIYFWEGGREDSRQGALAIYPGRGGGGSQSVTERYLSELGNRPCLILRQATKYLGFCETIKYEQMITPWGQNVVSAQNLTVIVTGYSCGVCPALLTILMQYSPPPLGSSDLSELIVSSEWPELGVDELGFSRLADL